MRQLNYSTPVSGSTMSLVGSALQPYDTNFTHTNASFQNVVVQGNYAYVASTGGNGTGIIGVSFSIYNISNPASPQLASYIETGTVAWTSGNSFLNGTYQLAVNGQYAYIFSSGSSYLYIVNIENPYAPFNVSGLLISGTPGSLYGGAYSNGYVYIATQNKGLTVVNVSNPLAPAQVFQEGGTTNKSLGVYVSGTTCFTTNYQTATPWTVRYLKAWDISTPTAPVLLSTYTLPAGTKPGEVTVNGNYAFVSDLNTSTVQIVNVSNLTAMSYVSSMAASASFNVTEGATFNIAANGNYCYITSGSNATYGGAIDFFDLTNIATPVKVATLQQGVPTSLFSAATIANNLLYVANYGVGGAYASSLNIYSTQTFVSKTINCSNLFQGSVQLIFNGSSSAGTYAVQGSDDSLSNAPSNWSSITSGSISGSGTTLLPISSLSYNYLNFVYTNTGTGGGQANFKFLGD